MFRLQFHCHLVTRANLCVIHQEQITVVADPLKHLQAKNNSWTFKEITRSVVEEDSIPPPHQSLVFLLKISPRPFFYKSSMKDHGLHTLLQLCIFHRISHSLNQIEPKQSFLSMTQPNLVHFLLWIRLRSPHSTPTFSTSSSKILSCRHCSSRIFFTTHSWFRCCLVDCRFSSSWEIWGTAL